MTNRLLRLMFTLLLALGFAGPAFAGVTVTFMARDFGEKFPHAFFVVEGRMDAGGPVVDDNYGFTAKHVSPAILLGAVDGEVVAVNKTYQRKSETMFSFPVSDAEYARLVAVVDKWKAIPGHSYNLNRRNCVHFVGDSARAVGLDAPDIEGLMLKPHSYLDALGKRNAVWIAARKTTGAPKDAAPDGFAAHPSAVQRGDSLVPR